MAVWVGGVIAGCGTGGRGVAPRSPCAPGLLLLEGACVGPREVDAYCGAPARGSSSLAACAMTTCSAGEPVDLDAGTCLSPRVARALMARTRAVPDDLALACHEGLVLVVHGEEITCLPLTSACPRTTAWDPGAARCAPIPACAVGEIRGDHGCERVVARAPGERPLVDVGRWTRTMIGAPGGEGTARFCQAFAGRPWLLDVGSGGARTVALSIELDFPDNDVTQTSGRVLLTDAASHQPIPGAAGRAAEKAIEAVLVPLRALGGASDAASATLEVRCTAHGGGTPFLQPPPSP
jgi:hypothetical protein